MASLWRHDRSYRGGAFLSIVVGLAIGCSDPISPIAGPLALVGVTLVDGTGGPGAPAMTVIVDGGLITEIGPASAVAVGPDTRTVDGAGRWLMPGLIDTHTHLPGPDLQDAFLRTLLSFGITTARSTAATPASGLDARARLEAGDLVGPRFLTAGRLIDGPQSIWAFASIVETEADVRDEVRRQAALSVDFIKLYVGLTPELVAAGVEEAHELGIPVIGHLGRTTWPEALEAGIDALTHGCYWGMAHSLVPQADSARFAEFFQPNSAFDPGLFADWTASMSLSDERFRDFAESSANAQVSIDPNLVLCEAVIWGTDLTTFERLQTELDVEPSAFPHPYSAGWSGGQRDAAKTAFITFLEVVAELHRRGSRITVGSDTRNPWMTPGAATLRELELLEAAGIPTEEVIRIATRNGAESLGVSGETGTIEVGKAADLVLLSADPTQAISNVRRIELVVAGGIPFTPSELRRSPL